MEKRWFDSSRKNQLNLYCPFNKSCLYLDGEKPEKVLVERNYLRTRVDALEGAVDFATAQVIDLRKRNAELEREKENIQKELVRALQAPFSKYEVKDIPENPKKRGAPFGHPGHFRKRPEGIDEYVDVRLEKCPDCGSEDLSPCRHTTEHVQEDIESGKVKATCFIHYYSWCFVCKKFVIVGFESDVLKSRLCPQSHSELPGLYVLAFPQDIRIYYCSPVRGIAPDGLPVEASFAESRNPL